MSITVKQSISVSGCEKIETDKLQMFYVAIAFFTAGAIVAAVANSFTALLVGRVLQGIGGGGLFPLSEILVTDLVPLRQRGQWFGFLSGSKFLISL